MISYPTNIRLYFLCNLIFFTLLVVRCSERSDGIKIRWNNGRATAISIPEILTKNIVGPPEHSISVHLITDQDPIAMLGNFNMEDGEIIFEPLVPFTRGLRYEILADGNRLSEILIPEPDLAKAPELLNIYPTQDTVPENLLKIYLHFSKPMREGVSAKHITLLQDGKDTVSGAFLDLQPELWNEDRTLLTLWLDPGRIKRELIPNRKLGTPLKKGNQYTLVVSSSWKDIQGSALREGFHKTFFSSSRDSISPDPKRWILDLPETDTHDTLNINLIAPLDYSLLLSSFHIENGNHEVIPGAWHINDEEKNLKFLPNKPWHPDKYSLVVETRLEDLAGNNLNRLFDENIGNKKEIPSGKTVTIDFHLKK